MSFIKWNLTRRDAAQSAMEQSVLRTPETFYVVKNNDESGTYDVVSSEDGQVAIGRREVVEAYMGGKCRMRR